MALRFWFREHSDQPMWKARCIYINEMHRGDPHRFHSFITTSFGDEGRHGSSYAFIVLPREWLNGKWIHIQGDINFWRGAGDFEIKIMDGTYDRSSDADFPLGAELAVKGSGTLQELAVFNDTAYGFDITTQADTDSGTEPYCTIMIHYIGNDDGDYSLRLLQILDIDGATVLHEETFDTAWMVHEHWNEAGGIPPYVRGEYDSTGSDYGYMSEGTIEAPPTQVTYRYNMSIQDNGAINEVRAYLDGETAPRHTWNAQNHLPDAPLPSGPGETWTSTFDVTFTEGTGTHTIRVEADDPSGNTGTWEEAVTV